MPSGPQAGALECDGIYGGEHLVLAGPDVLVVSLGTTGGWRAAAADLASSLERAGAAVISAVAEPVADVRTFALTDFVQARAARAAAQRAIDSPSGPPGAIIYCSVTASLLWPAPGAIWLDSTAAENRPGRHGIWQRTAERRRLAQAPLVMAMSAGTLPLLPAGHAEAVVVHSPIDPSGAPAAERDIAALTYAGDPLKKRLDLILEAWSRARRDGETLVVAGTDAPASAEGVVCAGRLAPADYRALLRRARVFVAAPLREDYGIAPLEALADGCLVVTTPAPGPYPALELASALDPRLVSEDLAAALRVALDDPLAEYGSRAAGLLAPFRREAVDRTIASEVLPRLLPGRKVGASVTPERA
jgi:hypothetical protein